MAFRADDISINTLIGEGSFVKGDLTVNGFIRIDGDIDGNLETDGAIIISEKARLRGNISAKSAIIGGIVLGNITVDQNVKLLSSSAVVGDVIARNVQIEENVIFHGHCISLKNKEKFDSQVENFLQKKAVVDKAGL